MASDSSPQLLTECLRMFFPAVTRFRLLIRNQGSTQAWDFTVDPGRAGLCVQVEGALEPTLDDAWPPPGALVVEGLAGGQTACLLGAGSGPEAALAPAWLPVLRAAIEGFRQSLHQGQLAHQLNVLCEINREINSQSELRPLLASIAENSARLLAADAVSVMLLDERSRSFRTFAGWKSWESEEADVVFSQDEGIVGKVAARQEGVLVADTASSPDFKPNFNSSLPPITSMLCVPLMNRILGAPRLIGVINASRRRFPDRLAREGFSETDLKLFEKFSEQVTAAIERSRVYEETRHRTLQLQIINEISKVVTSSLEQGENFERAVGAMAGDLGLSFVQLIVYGGAEVVHNFNSRADARFRPPHLESILRRRKWGKSARFVDPSSRSRVLHSKEMAGGRTAHLYLESPDPFFFEDPNNRRVVETIQDQLFIALSNFLLFQEIADSKRKLEELDRMKNELISIVSHDFRSPLQVIHAYSELLLLHGDMVQETRREYLNHIFQQIGHLRRLSEGLLKITRIESGEMQYAFDRLPLSVLLDNLGHRNLPAHPLRVVLPPDLPPMRADYDKLFEVMDNLVSNAIKFSPSGGEITIRARHSGEFVEVQVRDRGIGIPPEQTGSLFQKYHRIHNEQTKHIRGTGLGLYICKKLIEGHGGRIWVRSRPGRGATFAFTIPVFPE